MGYLIGLPLKHMVNKGLLEIAKIGKTVGLKGDLKLHNLSDFPEQFFTGASFTSTTGEVLTVVYFSPSKQLIRFKDYENVDLAKSLTNQSLFTTKELSKKTCLLSDNEYFWFDLEGLDIRESDILLGNIESIERIVNQDYLLVNTNQELLIDNKKYPKQFLIPYVDRYINKVELEKGYILVDGGIDILENS